MTNTAQLVHGATVVHQAAPRQDYRPEACRGMTWAKRPLSRQAFGASAKHKRTDARTHVMDRREIVLVIALLVVALTHLAVYIAYTNGILK